MNIFKTLSSFAPGSPSGTLSVLTLLIGCGVWTVRASEAVSKAPPPIYAEKLAPLLTPLDKALERRGLFRSADSTGAVLLDEEIDYVAEDGRIYNVEHLVYQALTEDGCKDVAKDETHFRRSEETIHLILAQTILPDGTKIPVQPNAAFIKSPQEREDQGLYDDGTDLVIMFPNIDVGAITESITLIERTEARIPGEYTRRFSWSNGWPKAETRRVVDLPAALAERLKITTLGENIPTPEASAPEAGRARLVWTKGKQAQAHWEENMPPTFQAGPYSWLSTIPDWNAIARWYAGLLAGRETLSPELAAQVDAWTKDARSPREIIEILTEKVSKDVRYVGLEFGIAGYQPSDCNAVWANRYGDCKDKANLLRAMLLHKGVPAKLVFLETTDAGLFEKRSPDSRQFDHVILTAESGPGDWIFCDPTIRYGRAGLISPADADRDVMILDGDQVQWARTPPAEGGKLSYSFDLKRDAQGETSGWVQFQALGYYATGYYEEFLGKDHDATVRAVADYLHDFYPTAEVVDVEVKLDGRKTDAFQYRAFLVIPSAGGDPLLTASLPVVDSLMPDVSEDGKRRTPFFQWRDQVEMTLRLELPPGIKPRKLPTPYHVEGQSLQAEASWKVEAPAVEGRMRIVTRDSVVTPAKFPAFRNSIRSFRNWLDQPLVLTAIEGNAEASLPSPSPAEVTLENFPIMPTAEGQRSLLETRFPADGNIELRKKALAKIVQYFPSDKETQFYAAANLALLDEKDAKTRAIPTLEKLLSQYRTSIEPVWILWGEYRLAFLFLDIGEKDKARALFLKVAKDEDSGEFRRAWSFFHAANLGSRTPPDEAIALLREGTEFDGEALSRQLPLLAELLLAQGAVDSLRESLGRIADRKSHYSEEALAALVDFAATRPADQAEKILAMVEQSGGADDPKVAEGLKEARRKSRWQSVWPGLQNKLKTHLASQPYPTKGASENAPEETIKKELEKALEARNGELSLALNLDLLTRFAPGPDFSERLWQSASRADWIERINGVGAAGPILPFLLELCSEIPRDNDAYYEGQIIRGRVRSRAGDHAGAEDVLVKVLSEPQFPVDFESSVRRDLGDALEKQGKYEQALAVYLPVQDRLGEYASFNDLILKAVYIQLHLGRRDEALALLKKLGEAPPAVARKADFAFEIAGLTRLARNRDEAMHYWDAAQTWRETWKALSAKLSPDGAATFEPVPVIKDLAALGATLGEASRDRNKSAFVKNWNRAISAALWDPAMALEAASVRENVGALFPELKGPTMAFLSSLLQPVRLEGNDARRREALLAHCHLDGGKFQSAADVTRPFLKADKTPDETNHLMRRIQGVAAYELPAERAAAIAALEEGLTLPEDSSARSYSVRILSWLYKLENRLSDEEDLLRRELENPRIKDSDLLSELQSRYRVLTQEKSAEQDFSLFVKEWMPVHGPRWLAYARPQALADTSGLGDQAQVMASPDTYFATLEATKFLFLISESEKLSYLERAQGWDFGCMRLMNLIASQPQADAFLRSIIESPRLTEEMRGRWVWMALYDAGNRLQKERFQKLCESPLVSSFNLQQNQGMEAFKITAGVDLLSIGSIEEAFAALGRTPLGMIAFEQSQTLFAAALRLGELDAAQKLFEQFKKFTFTKDVPQSSSTLALDFLKKLKQARRFTPLQAALREATLRQFPESGIQRPANFEDLRHRNDSELLDVRNGNEIRLYRILTRQIDPEDLDFWKEFADGISTPNKTALRREIGRILVEQAPDDQARAQAIWIAAGIVDLDDPEERAINAALIDPYRDPVKNPLAAKVARLITGRFAYRTGNNEEYENLILKDGQTHGLENVDWLALEYYLQQGKTPELKEVIERMSVEKLLTPGRTRHAIAALEMAGLEDEATLAREAGRKELYDLILDCWAKPTSAALSRAFDLAETLGEPSLVPEAWMNDMEKSIQDPLARSNLLVDIARLKKDWKQMERHAAEAIAEFPTYYHFYWLQGEALNHLGRKTEALSPLKVYAAHAKDERHYREAVALLAENDKTASPKNAP